MKKQAEQDFRVAFDQMAPGAVIGREELAALLNRTPAAISLLGHRGRLPRKAFPNERKACWFVRDVRNWLDELANSRPAASQEETSERHVGRPRKSVD